MTALLIRLETLVSGWIARASDTRFALIVVGLLTALIVLPGQSGLPVTDRDEGRYIQASKQMMETGDYVDIRFRDVPRYKKPVGIYWLQVAAAKITGFGAEAPHWVYRLPSALGIIGAALLTIWAVRPITGPPGAALAGLIVGTTTLSMGEGHIAKTDAALLFTVVALQGALLRIWLDEQVPRFDAVRGIFWTAMAAGILIKGPIILIVAAGTLVWLCLSERSFDPWRQTRPLLGLALLVVLALPWFVAIGIISEGAFYGASVGDDLLGKVGAASNAHWGPPGYYLMTVWISFFPWAALGLAALPHAWAHRSSDAVRFLAAWAIPVWAVFAVTTTKLPHYILPILPAMSALIGLWLTAEGPERGWRRLGAVMFVVGGGALVALPLAAMVMFAGAPDLQVISIAAAGAVVTLIGAVALWRGALRAHIGLAALAAVLLLPTLPAIVIPKIPAIFPSPHIAALHQRFDACAPQPLWTIGYREPSLLHYAGTETVFADPGEAVELFASERPGARVTFDLSRPEADVEAVAAAAQTPLFELGRIEAFNTNRGRETTLVLMAADRDAALLAPCAD